MGGGTERGAMHSRSIEKGKISIDDDDGRIIRRFVVEVIGAFPHYFLFLR
jgi:hypothetical protein